MFLVLHQANDQSQIVINSDQIVAMNRAANDQATYVYCTYTGGPNPTVYVVAETPGEIAGQVAA